MDMGWSMSGDGAASVLETAELNSAESIKPWNCIGVRGVSSCLRQSCWSGAAVPVSRVHRFDGGHPRKSLGCGAHELWREGLSVDRHEAAFAEFTSTSPVSSACSALHSVIHSSMDMTPEGA